MGLSGGNTQPAGQPPCISSTLQALRCSIRSVRVDILDTDYILRQVVESVRPCCAQTLDGPPGRRARSFASSHVLRELYAADAYGHRDKWEKLAEQSEGDGRPTTPDVFREVFERKLLEHITFVDVAGMFDDAPLVEEVARQANGRGAS